jgi:hypothetical protein
MSLDPSLRLAIHALVIVVCLLDACVRGLRRRRLLRHGVTTTGTVVRHVDDPEGFTPVVRFVTREGEAREMSPDTLRGDEDWSVGRAVPVIYLPDAPARARVLAPGHMWSDVLASLGVGLLFAVVAITLLAFRVG